MTQNSFIRAWKKVEEIGDRFVRLGETGLNNDEAARMRAARLAAVFRNTHWMMAANIVNSLLTMIIFWNSEIFLASLLWAGSVIAIAAVTLAAWWKNRHKPAPVRASIRGIRKATIYAAILSFLWAMQAAVFFPIADAQQKLVIVAITVGMATGGGIALATIPSAAIIFSLFIGIGSAIALIHDQEILGVNLMLLFVIYFAIVNKASLNLSRSLAERVRSQLAVREQRDVIGMLLNDFEENASDWLWGTDRDLNLLRASPRFFGLVGRETSELIGQPFWQVLPVKDSACSLLTGGRCEMLRHIMETAEPFRDLEIAVEVGGELRSWSLSAKPIYEERGVFVGYRGVARDITIARQARNRIEHMAKHDPLTDIGNRTLLSERLELALHRQRNCGEEFSLFVLDLDHFKRVNDTHGHAAGDKVLKEAARRLTKLIGNGDSIARLGGDEFAIVQTSPSTTLLSGELAERIRKSLHEPFPIGSGVARIGVSIGIASAPTDGIDGDLLLRNADLALYRAKSEGRNRYCYFDESLDAAARRRNLIEYELREAISKGGLSLSYQPLADAKTGETVCFEALLRWYHPTLGEVGPAEFIPIAEDSGIITELGDWTLREALHTASKWPEHVRIAVNLSPRQFASPHLLVTVRDALEEFGITHDRLELEVTESLLLDSPKTVEATLIAFRALGIRIALDDFGTGYSSLSYLREYRFDKLKIDRSFIRDIETNLESRAIVEAIIRLGGALHMSLVAEGVETEAQLEALRALGCGQIQGFLIGRAKPEAELGQYLGGDLFAELEMKRA